METHARDYHSYLLRLWRVPDDGEQWRATLEEVQTGELIGFTRLADLLDFLQSVAGSALQDQVAGLQPGDHPGS